MLTAPALENETERLADLRALGLLDTAPEERFDRIVQLAAAVFRVPIAYVALVDSDRQWLKAKCGLTVDQTGRDVSFCGHTIEQHGPLIVPDAVQDERFFDNPLVTGNPFIRFYAGHPLRGPGGHNIATFCVADRRPRQFDAHDLDTFRRLAGLAEYELRMMDVIRAQSELLEARRDLATAQARIDREINEAAAYVRSSLPERLADGPVRADWIYEASSQLGGDLFGYDWLDEDYFAAYLLDVSGHGIGASLLSMSVHNLLRARSLPTIRFDDPAAVLQGLNTMFSMADHGGKFLTVWYAVFHRPTRELYFASAGHHPALLVTADGQCRKLGEPAFMIGAVPDIEYRTNWEKVPAGSRLYLFSDGAFEVAGPDGELLGYDGLSELLRRPHGSRPHMAAVTDQIRQWHHDGHFADDFSLVELAFE
jgi:sigma-B regulation protein RsbU (phosphoserine phosphatase)